MKKYLIFLLFFVPMAAFCLAHNNSKQPPVGAEKIPVHVITAEIKKIPFTYKTIGIAAPLEAVTVSPQIGGKLLKLFFNEGDFVQKGELLAKIDDASAKAGLDKAVAELASASAQFDEAKTNLVRYRKLQKNSVVSKKILEEKESLYEQAQAAVDSAKSQIDTAKINLDHTNIYAPVAGRIGLIKKHEGNLVAENDGEGIVQIVQISPISVIFSLPQQFFYTLKNTDSLSVSVFDDAGNFLENGKISAYDNNIDDENGTLKVRAVFSNSEQKIWSGQTLSVHFSYGENISSVVLPNNAVRAGNGTNYVFKETGGKVVITPVETGYQNEKNTVILSGVTEGETVICDNFFRLKNGTAVKILPDGE